MSLRYLFVSSSLASSSAVDTMKPWLASELTFAMSGAFSPESMSFMLAACSDAASALALLSGERGAVPNDFKTRSSSAILESDF